MANLRSINNRAAIFRPNHVPQFPLLPVGPPMDIVENKVPVTRSVQSKDTEAQLAPH